MAALARLKSMIVAECTLKWCLSNEAKGQTVVANGNSEARAEPAPSCPSRRWADFEEVPGFQFAQAIHPGAYPGVLVRENNSRYEGFILDGMAHGEGTFSAGTHGYRYDGQWEKDKAHGHGRYTHPDGNSYVGAWYANEKCGYGAECWADGSSYMGEFQKNLKHGLGVYKSAVGSTYNGEFREDMMDGQGTFKFATQRKYVGQWKQGQMNGKGCMHWPDGSKFEGGFERDQRHGEGTFTWQDGKVYRGQWCKGKRHGSAVAFNLNGSEMRVEEWMDDKQVLNDESVSLPPGSEKSRNSRASSNDALPRFANQRLI